MKTKATTSVSHNTFKNLSEYVAILEGLYITTYSGYIKFWNKGLCIFRIINVL